MDLRRHMEYKLRQIIVTAGCLPTKEASYRRGAAFRASLELCSSAWPDLSDHVKNLALHLRQTFLYMRHVAVPARRRLRFRGLERERAAPGFRGVAGAGRRADGIFPENPGTFRAGPRQSGWGLKNGAPYAKVRRRGRK